MNNCYCFECKEKRFYRRRIHWGAGASQITVGVPYDADVQTQTKSASSPIMINVDYLWAGVGFLTGLSVKTAFSREAATAGISAHTTYGRKNHSKPKRVFYCYSLFSEHVNLVNGIADMR